MTAPPNPNWEDPFDVALGDASLAKRTLQGTVATASVQVAKISIQFISQMALARLLFPKDYGLLAMAGPLLGFVQLLADIGLGQEIIRRSTLVHARVSALFWVNVGLSFGLAILFAALSPLVALAFREPDLVRLMVVLSVLIPLSALAIHPFALLSRQMRFGLIAKYDLISNVAGIFVTIACAWFGFGYWSLVLGQATTSSVNSILGWSGCGWRPMRPAFHEGAWADLKSGGSILGANLATFVTTSADNVIVGLTTNSVALGLYDRSYRLVIQPLGQMMAPVSRVAVPLLSRLSDRPDQYRSAYVQILKALILITVPGMLVCISSGHTVVAVLLGDRWLSAAPVFAWISVGGLTSSTYSSAYWLFISQGRQGDLMRTSIICLGINLASFIVGAFWGIVGIATAGAIGFVLAATPLMLVNATKFGPVHHKDVLYCLLPSTIVGALTYCLLIYFDQRVSHSGFMKLVTLTCISYGCFTILILLAPGGRLYISDLKRLVTIIRN